MSPKIVHRNTILGQQGINLIERMILEMGYLWHPRTTFDAGIDGTIELRDPAGGKALNAIIAVQSKATAGKFNNENPRTFTFYCEERDLTYWLQGNLPVILVVSRPATNEAYWVSVKDYFRDPARHKSRAVHFSKETDRLDKDAAPRLLTLGVQPTTGVYLAPTPKAETLFSNLLRTHTPNSIYVARTDLRMPWQVWHVMKQLKWQAGSEWLLTHKFMLSFNDLSTYPWTQVCEQGTVEQHDAAEWSHSDNPDRRNEFAALLKQTLRQKLRDFEVRYNDYHECFYFRATRNLNPRRIEYQGINRKTDRIVFEGYPKRKDPTTNLSAPITHYRHAACQARFHFMKDSWFLEITPTYYFTMDGLHTYRYHEERLKGIKRLERNAAVLGQVVMWASILTKPADLFTPAYPFLSLGPVLTFPVDFGLDEGSWVPNEDDEARQIIAAEENNPSLFYEENA